MELGFQPGREEPRMAKGSTPVGGNRLLRTCVTEAGMKCKLEWSNVPGASRLGVEE